MICKNFNYYIIYEDGRIYSNKTNKFLKFLNGENVPEFKNCGIVSITDLKK